MTKLNERKIGNEAADRANSRGECADFFFLYLLGLDLIR